MAASDHLVGLADDSERRLERLFASFDSAWKRGARPRIADFLPEKPAEDRRAAVFELALIDLEYAIARDPSPRIELYLAEFPELASDRDRVLELADREYLLRHEAGVAPSVREYVARFPDLAARLIFRLEKDPAAPDGHLDDATRPYVGRPPESPAEIILNPAVDDSVPTALPEIGPPRYRHIRHHARGGLGEVFVAEDTVLGRRVALKRIRPEFANDETVRRRFRREAEITAGLEHPGIAPIHELITDRNGQCWYVMRFLKGHTLRSAIEHYHRAKPGADPVARSLDFRGLMTRFVSVCETMSYVHKCGVVHRDLTPANVMLGDHGETIVLDWGFATASGEVDINEISTSMAPVASPLDASLMQSGKLFGTPAFMAPEQAGMHQTAVGPASDIYCLGAILFMLLTSRPPFVDRDLAKTLEKIQKGDYPRPRELRPETSAALEAVCLKAMAIKPEHRYGDAQDLGRDIDRWLADEPVSVYREPMADRIARWARRNRTRLVLAAAVTLVALIAGGSYGVVNVKRRADAERVRVTRRERVEAEALAILREARALAVKAKDDPTKWAEAIPLLQGIAERLEAESSTGGGLLDARDLLKSCREGESDEKFVRDLKDARLKGALRTEGNYDVRAKRDEYRRLFTAHGLDLSADEVAGRIGMSRLRAILVATLDDWALELDKANQSERTLRRKLLTLAGEADADVLSNQIRNAMEDDDREALVRLANKLNKRAALATQLHTVGYALYKAGKLAEAEAFLSEGQTIRSGDFWINTTLAQVCLAMDPPRAEKASRHYDIAVNLLPGSTLARLNHGNALLQTGEIDRAILVYQEANRLTADSPEAHYALGYGYLAKGRFESAAEQFRIAVRHRPDFPEAHNGFVRASLDGGHIDRCRADYEAWIREAPGSAEAHCGLGLALANSPGRAKEAVQQYRRAIELKPEFAPAHHLLGNAMLDRRQFDEALGEQARAIELNPDSPLHQYGLGRALAGKGRFSDAEAAFRRAIRSKRDFAEAHWDLGLSLISQGKFDAAVAALKAGHPPGAKPADPDPERIVSEAEKFARFRPRLEEFVQRGSGSEVAATSTVLAKMCHHLHRHIAAAKFWTEALADDGDDVARQKHQQDGDYHAAARDAALAGTAVYKDEPALDETARERHRDTARRWLETEQGLYTHVIANRPELAPIAADVLKSWKTDPDLACVRDVSELDKLADPERKLWQSFWSRIDDLIVSAAGRPESRPRDR